MADRNRLESAIAAQESLRGLVDDDVVDAAIEALRQQLESTRHEQRRRLVTVLFADLHGFTALSETLDAEILTDLMNRLWRRLDRIIADHHGHVDKHMGDSVMAVWGIDGTDELDADRAVRAGLALQAAVLDTATAASSDLAARVGINTGPALIGAVGTARELTVMGDTVNVASRLEQAAPIGSVLISHDTYRHIRGVFEVAVRDPIAVRGKSEPMHTYVVRGVKPRAFRIGARGVEGVETRTVGREFELGRLQVAYEHVADGHGLRAALVVGEAGVGKSRLLYDLRVWLELRSEKIRLVEGRARVGRQGTTFGLIRDMLTRRFEIRDSDTAGEVDRKLRQGFGEVLAPGDVDTVASWLGLGTTSRETTGSEHLAALGQAALVTWLRRVTDDMPTVILLEDLHWADPESLGVVWTIAQELVTNQLLVVGISRPGTDLDGPWFDDYPFAERIALDPLDRTASVALVHELLQRVDHIPDSVVDLIVDRSDGNPFFVEEIVKMLRDHGVIIDADADSDEEGWSIVPDRLDPSDVPTTISGVLQARLDQLDPDGRAVLQHAAVMGRTFWDDAVAAMIARPLTSDAFATAMQRELVFPREHSSFDGSQEFVFKHALLREVAYETVLLRDRGALHARAAEWLTARAGDRVSEYLDTIADHHRRAAQHDEAARWLFRAATAAFERGLVPVTLDKLGDAIVEWEQGGTPPPVEALLLLGEAQRRQGDPDAAGRTLRDVLDRVGADDPERRAEALYLLAEVAFDHAAEADEIALLQEAEQLVSGDRSLVRCRIAVGLAWWETRYGDLAKAEQHGRNALALADELQSDRMRWRTHGVLGPIAAMRDDLDDAERHAIASVEIARRLGDMGGEALSIGNLGVVTHLLGDSTGSVEHYRDARSYYERDVEFRAVIGDRVGAIQSTFNRAQVLVRLGEFDDAAAAIRDGLTRSLDSKFARHLLLGVEIEADLLLNIGRVDDGLDLLAVIRDHPATQRGDWQEIDRILGRVALTADALDGRLDPDGPSDIEEIARTILAG